MKLQWMTTLLLTSCISLAGYCGSGATEMHSPIPLQQEIPPAPGYFNGRLWRLDASASSPFPSHFRTSASAFDLSLPHKLPLPSRKGLDRLRISGSAQLLPPSLPISGHRHPPLIYLCLISCPCLPAKDLTDSVYPAAHSLPVWPSPPLHAI